MMFDAFSRRWREGGQNRPGKVQFCPPPIPSFSALMDPIQGISNPTLGWRWGVCKIMIQLWKGTSGCVCFSCWWWLVMMWDRNHRDGNERLCFFEIFPCFSSSLLNILLLLCLSHDLSLTYTFSIRYLQTRPRGFSEGFLNHLISLVCLCFFLFKFIRIKWKTVPSWVTVRCESCLCMSHY